MSPKQKIAPNCNFFAIRDRREFPRSQIKAQKRSKMAILRLFSALRERRGVPNRKKLQKDRYFCFCDWLIVAMGRIPPRMNRIRTEIRACTCRATKNRPKAVSFSNIWLGQQDSRALRALFPLAQAPAGKSLKTCHRHVFFTGFHLIGSNPLHPARQQKTARRRFRSQIYGWASRIRTYITGTKNQGPAIGRWPSVCHKAFCDYNVFGMVKPNKQPIRQNATTQHERRHATYRARRTYRALSSQNATALAAATLRESTPCAIGIFTV